MAPETLAEVLTLLAEQRHVPIAGGTELMVALAAGKLPQTPLVSIGHLRELRFIEISENVIVIGAGTTFTDLRRSEVITRELPLLSEAASWTGSIANQNRGTLGGNVANASPAADSAPALLVYEADMVLVSSKGQRSVPYRDFHRGYKKTALRTGELVHSFRVARVAPDSVFLIRKVGARQAQAISKVAIAGLGWMVDGVVREIRLGAASVRETPCRLDEAEQIVRGKRLSEEMISAARAAVIAQVRPIDDIRSTANYRSAVAANLVEEFLHLLRCGGRSSE